MSSSVMRRLSAKATCAKTTRRAGLFCHRRLKRRALAAYTGAGSGGMAFSQSASALAVKALGTGQARAMAHEAQAGIISVSNWYLAYNVYLGQYD